MPASPDAFSTSTDDWIGLPAPKLEGALSVEKALSDRRSVRRYSARPLTLSEVAQLLWAAQGTTSPSGLRTAPSAGALYPLEVHLAASDVDGIPPGIYRYDPRHHALEPVASGARRRELTVAAEWQDSVLHAPAVVAISAVYRRTTVKYRDRGERYAHMEVGHAAQNLCLQAVALGLSTVVVGAFRDREVKEVLGLRADTEPLCLVPVGRR